MKINFRKKETLFGFLGMRVVKTALAVFICFLIGFIRPSLPFYSAIAAILCMKNDHKDSLETGKSRMVGTAIGGVYGFLAVVIAQFLHIELLGHLYYFMISIFIIPIIYTNIKVKSAASTYISCVVFLSISVAHGNDISPIFFAANRVIDTIIGILVSLFVNFIL